MVYGTKIYEDAKDVNVSGRVFYAKTASGATTLYTDSAETIAATGADVLSAYLAGNLVIVNAGSICAPTACVIADGKVKVDILTVASSTATVVTCQAAIAADDTKTVATFNKIVPAT